MPYIFGRVSGFYTVFLKSLYRRSTRKSEKLILFVLLHFVSPLQVCTDSVHQSGTIWSQRSGSVRFHKLDIFRDKAHLCSATDPDHKHCKTECKSVKSTSAPCSTAMNEHTWKQHWFRCYQVLQLVLTLCPALNTLPLYTQVQLSRETQFPRWSSYWSYGQ